MSSDNSDDVIYFTDKNNYFQVVPPKNWRKRIYDDPRSKVSFSVRKSGGALASLVFLSHPLSGNTNIEAVAQEKLNLFRRIEQDAQMNMIDFNGVKAAQIEATITKRNSRMKLLLFKKYGRSYTITFISTPTYFNKYLSDVEKALESFKCIPPEGIEFQSESENEKIQQEKIRVWITGLKDLSTAIISEELLLDIGWPALRALKEATKTGTPEQRKRAIKLIDRIKSKINSFE